MRYVNDIFFWVAMLMTVGLFNIARIEMDGRIPKKKWEHALICAIFIVSIWFVSWALTGFAT